MTKKALVLIDGNNLYHCLKQLGILPTDLDFFKFSDFVCMNLGIERKHIIYYNSIPKMMDPSFFKHKEFLIGLEKQGIEVRTRVLQYKSARESQLTMLDLINKMGLCEKCKPKAINNLMTWIGTVIKKEKGIDVMIAVEIIKNSIEKKYESCVVISGDVDLLSAMKFARDMGGEVISSFIDSGYSSEIRQNFRHFILKRIDLLKNCLKEEI